MPEKKVEAAVQPEMTAKTAVQYFKDSVEPKAMEHLLDKFGCKTPEEFAEKHPNVVNQINNLQKPSGEDFILTPSKEFTGKRQNKETGEESEYVRENLEPVGILPVRNNGKTSLYYAKRFAVTSVTRDKEYDITQGKPGSQIVWFTANHNGEAETVRVQLRPKPKLKKTSFEYDFAPLAIKSKTARGNLVSKNSISRISLKSKGVSTIAGKDIWYDSDIQKLNEDGRGIYLGQFEGEDKVLAVFRNGSFYTTSYDLVNKYQGDVLLIEKFDPEKTFTALYYDGAAKTFYVKRFSFVLSDNTPLSFIAAAPKSYLAGLSGDARPQYRCIFKDASRNPEDIDAEQWIGKKGYTAKGKKCHDREKLKKVLFIDPLPVPDEEAVPEQPDIPAAEPDMPEPADQAPIELDFSLPTDVIDLPEPEPAPEAKASKTAKKSAPKPRKEEEPIEIFEEPTLF